MREEAPNSPSTLLPLRGKARSEGPRKAKLELHLLQNRWGRLLSAALGSPILSRREARAGLRLGPCVPSSLNPTGILG